MKKLTSLILTFALLFSCSVLFVNAEVEENDYSEEFTFDKNFEEITGADMQVSVMNTPLDLSVYENLDAPFEFYGIMIDSIELVVSMYDLYTYQIYLHDVSQQLYAEEVWNETGVFWNVTVYFHGPYLTKGDLDNDGRLTITDYMVLKSAVLGKYELTATQSGRADVVAGNGINAADYLKLKYYVKMGFDPEDVE